MIIWKESRTWRSINLQSVVTFYYCLVILGHLGAKNQYVASYTFLIFHIKSILHLSFYFLFLVCATVWFFSGSQAGMEEQMILCGELQQPQCTDDNPSSEVGLQPCRSSSASLAWCCGIELGWSQAAVRAATHIITLSCFLVCDMNICHRASENFYQLISVFDVFGCPM